MKGKKCAIGRGMTHIYVYIVVKIERPCECWRWFSLKKILVEKVKVETDNKQNCTTPYEIFWSIQLRSV